MYISSYASILLFFVQPLHNNTPQHSTESNTPKPTHTGGARPVSPSCGPHPALACPVHTQRARQHCSAPAPGGRTPQGFMGHTSIMCTAVGGRCTRARIGGPGRLCIGRRRGTSVGKHGQHQQFPIARHNQLAAAAGPRVAWWCAAVHVWVLSRPCVVYDTHALVGHATPFQPRRKPQVYHGLHRGIVQHTLAATSGCCGLYVCQVPPLLS